MVQSVQKDCFIVSSLSLQVCHSLWTGQHLYKPRASISAVMENLVDILYPLTKLHPEEREGGNKRDHKTQRDKDCPTSTSPQSGEGGKGVWVCGLPQCLPGPKVGMEEEVSGELETHDAKLGLVGMSRI